LLSVDEWFVSRRPAERWNVCLVDGGKARKDRWIEIMTKRERERENGKVRGERVVVVDETIWPVAIAAL